MSEYVEKLKSWIVSDKDLESIKSRLSNMENDVKNIYDKLKNSSDGLKRDALTLKNSGNGLFTVIIAEAKNISNAFEKYGISLKNASVGLARSSYKLAKELADAPREMEPSLQHLTVNAGNLPYCGINIFCILHHTFQCMHALISRNSFGKNGEHDGLLHEVMEAFIQISNASKELSRNYDVFANVSEDAPRILSNVINVAIKNINNATMNFMNNLVGLSNNLSINLE